MKPSLVALSDEFNKAIDCLWVKLGKAMDKKNFNDVKECTDKIALFKKQSDAMLAFITEIMKD